MPDTLRLAGALLAPHSHQESDLLDGDVYARLAASETVTGLWGFPAAGISIGEEPISSPSAGVLAVGGDLQVGGGISVGGGPTLSKGDGDDDLLLSGDIDVSGVAAVGSLASIDTSGRQALRVRHLTGDISIFNHGAGAFIRPTINTSTQGFAYGLTGEVEFAGTAPYSYVTALAFNSIQNGADLAWMHGVYVSLISYSGKGAVLYSHGVEVVPSYQGSKPGTFRGLYVRGYSGMNTVHGVRVEDFSGTTIHLLEIGPSTPYLRLAGGGDPGANQTNLYLKESTTLRRVQWKAGNALGAGDRVLVLV